ncbi:hypothetical protein KKH27_04800 [bacterium]|nr:hypothetical protein [bacterium]MBU1983548.1 hypothetical protein [bacterium]
MGRSATWISVLALVLWVTACNAGENGKSYNGISWGFSRTWWSADANNEGYPAAGNAGAMVELRRVRMLNDRVAFSPYLQYFWMRSTITTLICDTCYGETVTERSFFREIDLGFNLHLFPVKSCDEFYIGGGPSVRWGQAARREAGTATNTFTAKAAWFGVTVLAGIRTPLYGTSIAFFEPQFTFSPDQADRWQAIYPPDKMSVHMGVLW